MASRRAYVKNASKTGRKPLVQRMDDEVRRICIGLNTKLVFNVEEWNRGNIAIGRGLERAECGVDMVNIICHRTPNGE